MQEYCDVRWVNLCGLFGEADGREEIARVDLEVVDEELKHLEDIAR